MASAPLAVDKTIITAPFSKPGLLKSHSQSNCRIIVIATAAFLLSGVLSGGVTFLIAGKIGLTLIAAFAVAALVSSVVGCVLKKGQLSQIRKEQQIESRQNVQSKFNTHWNLWCDFFDIRSPVPVTTNIDDFLAAIPEPEHGTGKCQRYFYTTLCRSSSDRSKALQLLFDALNRVQDSLSSDSLRYHTGTRLEWVGTPAQIEDYGRLATFQVGVGRRGASDGVQLIAMFQPLSNARKEALAAYQKHKKAYGLDAQLDRELDKYGYIAAI